MGLNRNLGAYRKCRLPKVISPSWCRLISFTTGRVVRPPSSSDRRLRSSAFNRWAGYLLRYQCLTWDYRTVGFYNYGRCAAFKYRWLYPDRVSGEIDIRTATELLTAVQRRDCRSRCPCGLVLGRCSWTLLKSRSSARPEQRSSSRGGATVSFAMPATGCLVHPKTVATIRVRPHPPFRFGRQTTFTVPRGNRCPLAYHH